MFNSSRQRAIRLAKESPLVVMGRGHSGTRVLAWALQKLGIQMGATEEVPTGDVQDLQFSRAIKRICRASLHRSPTLDADPRLLKCFHRSLDRYLDWLADTRGAWGWKFPETYLVPNYVAATFPQARYIHMLRDGRDVAFKHHLTDDPNRRLGRKLLTHLGALNLPHHVQAAMSWDFQVRRFEEFAQYTRPTMCTITFESLCSEPVATMQTVCRFVGREMTPDCRDYLQEQIRPEKVAQYRSENPSQLAEVESAIAPSLARLGYCKQAA
jgi:hypothetical protein